MSYNSFLKVIGLIAAGVVHYFATTPPQPPPTLDERQCATYKFEKILPWLRFGTMCTLSIALFNESLLILASAYPETFSISPFVYRVVCPAYSDSHNGSAMQSFSVPFTIGLALALVGGAIRIWCYRVLGQLFTYEVTLRPTHVLVKAAPYNIVRHPSYTGLFLHFTGVAILHFAPGGWNRECDIMYTRGYGSWVVIWLSLSAYTFVSVWNRGAVEDAILRGKFGAAWEQYRREVPSKFVPWIA